MDFTGQVRSLSLGGANVSNHRPSMEDGRGDGSNIGRAYRMKKSLIVASVFLLGLLAFSALPGRAAATGQDKAMYMVCPSVGLNNPNGMWVIGGHGAYFVMMLMDPTTGMFKMVSVPDHVSNQAQIASAWGHYHSIPTYPNFSGMAMLMGTGWAAFLSGVQGGASIGADHMVQVTINGDGTTTIKDMDGGGVVTIQGTIPLGSAVFWAG